MAKPPVVFACPGLVHRQQVQVGDAQLHQLRDGPHNVGECAPELLNAGGVADQAVVGEPIGLLQPNAVTTAQLVPAAGGRLHHQTA
jgi:hypothetical protein